MTSSVHDGWVNRAGRVIAGADTFAGLQRPDGSVADHHGDAEDLLAEVTSVAAALLRDLGQSEAAEALLDDVNAWIARGLATPPRFACTRDVYRPPADGELTLMLAPTLTPNSGRLGGRYLECFLARRQEPAELSTLGSAYPHPKNRCATAKLLLATAGFTEGNCVVFFPENIAADKPAQDQSFSMFFFDKFERIYRNATLPEAAAALGANDTFCGGSAWCSSLLDSDECYRARALWGYLHDYFHHQGPRPLDQHLAMKLNWYAGVLEELKVDAQVALASSERGVPYGAQIFEFVLFERLFRYPRQPDATANFDAASGVLLAEWLRLHYALGGTYERRVLDRDRTCSALNQLVAQIEHLEAAAADDDDYRREARLFVRQFLPEGEPGRRYRFPAGYLLGPTARSRGRASDVIC